MRKFDPPPFRTHPLIRGGHLQTMFSAGRTETAPIGTQQHVVLLPDQDAIVLHDDCPANWSSGDPAILLAHGLSGCHGSPYMIRLANRFTKLGQRVFRMDMRGRGAAANLARELSHAGRSDDLMQALSFVAAATAGPLQAIGVSLGANQLLRGVGRVGAGLDSTPDWFPRLTRIAAVAPPLDLLRCSDNMQRSSRRIYNRYFIRQLLSRIPTKIREREDCQAILSGPRPKTLRELDDRMTAPMSGFADAEQYYDFAAAKHVTIHNPIETLLLVASDDPIVPIDSFVDHPERFPTSTQLLVSNAGGHAAFIGPGRHCWMEEVLQQWFIA